MLQCAEEDSIFFGSDVNDHDHVNDYGGVHGGMGLSPDNTAYKWWSCHSGFGKLLCKLSRNLLPPAMGTLFIVFFGMLGFAISAIKIHGRKQISIRTEHWVHLSCAGI